MCLMMPARNFDCARLTGWTKRSPPNSGIATSALARPQSAEPSTRRGAPAQVAVPRQPLNAIIGVTEMLREDAEALNQDPEPLDRVLGAGRHLLVLINDILDLSKIEAGRMELQLESFALAPLIAGVAKTIELLAAKNANEVTLNSSPAITLYADKMRRRQALFNLMINANNITA